MAAAAAAASGPALLVARPTVQNCLHDIMEAKTITLAECQEHMSDKDCWLVIEGKVYDVTPFLDEHPGGFDTLVSNSGERQAPAARPDPPYTASESLGC
jgi:cytochrome b involved in lipid metabolism